VLQRGLAYFSVDTGNERHYKINTIVQRRKGPHQLWRIQ
jgi:hypothetical protein